ncbi:unnamed protein product [Spirodela intermedia]|uniref:Uncharacterized protein n=2 Tax=Spirodela intermedia TaxID=51605 RepID=A0A7I8JQJ3_SPIIN|nr:unnamed protein product [Spirodela intermedia]CAA6672055.1 unnamed protein product [Spirodela intermedia]CAA7409221.1 unnamed protein product [Spirodela intermedia]
MVDHIKALHEGHPLADSKVKTSNVDSEVGFFSKIRALWIHIHICFIFRVTTCVLALAIVFY